MSFLFKTPKYEYPSYTPSVPDVPSAPSTSASDYADKETKKLKKRRKNTILTSPQGILEPAPGEMKTLLGE